MRVLVLSQYYPPEVGATQTRAHHFAAHLAKAGHDVSVVAEVPNHPKGVIFDGYRGRAVRRDVEDGVETVRVWVYTSPRKSFWRRIAFYATYMINAVLAALFVLRRRPDVIFATSPPLPVLIAARVLSICYRCPLVADIRDIWPAAGVALGELRGDRVVRAAQHLERALYRQVDAITVVTHGFVDHVVAEGADPDRVFYLPNGTLPEVFTPEPVHPTLRADLGEPTLLLGFFGNHGIAQALPAVVEAATRLRDRPDIHVLFVGEGPVKAELVSQAERAALDNITFRDQVPIDQVSELIAACDLAIVPLRRLEILETFVPSKLFDFLACATPVILTVDGEARRILEASGGGVYAPPEDAAALEAALRDLVDDPGRLTEMGAQGREYVLAHHSRHDQAARLEELLRHLASGGRDPAPSAAVRSTTPSSDDDERRSAQTTDPAPPAEPAASSAGGTRMQDLGRLARTLRHVPPTQVAHRVRLRTKKRLYGLAPALAARRFDAAPGPVPGWPAGFGPLDAQTEAVGRPSLEENLAGSFELIGERRDLGSPIDWQPTDASQLWRFHLHYFEWAWVLLADPDEQATAAVTSLYRSWAEANPVGRWDAWAPYAASLRAWTLCALAPHLDLGDELAAELGRHTRYLRANLEFDIGGNHLIKNLKALLGLAVYLGDDDLLHLAGRLLARQLDIQILADGGHYELSPGYHAQVLGDLIDVAGLLDAAETLPGLVAKLRHTVARMQDWLAALVQPDGSVPMLNDSMPVSEQRRIALGVPEASREPVTVLEASGYVVLRPRPDVCLVMDVGAPCPPELPAHAHADALSITLQVAGEPVLVDTGTSVYGTGERRQYERSTRAHNTVEVDGHDQTEVWGAFRAGRRHRVTLHTLDQQADEVTIRASHDGYRFLPGAPVHERTLSVSADGVQVEDVVSGDGNHTVRQFWHLAEGAGSVTDDGATIAGEARLSVDLADPVSVDRIAPGGDDLGSVALGHNHRVPAPCLVVTAEQPALPVTIRTTITW